MSCCGLLRDGHGGGGCWLIVGDGGGGLVGGLLLAMVAGVGCWGNGGIEGRWRCWCIVSCGGQLLSGCWDWLPSGFVWC